MGQFESDTEGPLAARLRELVEEVIAGTPLYVVDVSVRGRKGSHAIDIFIDSDEALSVKVLADVSRELEFLMEAEELIPGRYHLNVSSPGVDRPLAVPRQYKKNIGRPVRVHYRKEDGTGNAEIVGTLKVADDRGIEVSGSDDATRRIDFESILWTKVQLPW